MPERHPGHPSRHRRHRPPARGAALMIAMVLLTVVATLASGMVWQQWRATEIEAAERSRVQLYWLTQAGMDYARLILREDQFTSQRDGAPTSLQGTWATPLKEARLSSMLAADRENSADVDLDAFLSGAITDAQARFNLRQLVIEGKLVKAQVDVLARLCEAAGLPADVAPRLAERLLAAWQGTVADAPLVPQSVDDLVWLGLDAATVKKLAPLVVLLPENTPVNLNTASREVLAAVVPGLDLGGADRLLQIRSRTPFKTLQEANAQLGLELPAGQVGVQSNHFEAEGLLRLDDRVISERYLLQRRQGLQVQAIQRLRSAGYVTEPR
jgi:general secretion pathway protein K